MSTKPAIIVNALVIVEGFLRKIIDLDIFETLIFNYRTKVNSSDLSAQFHKVLIEFVKELQYLLCNNPVQKECSILNNSEVRGLSNSEHKEIKKEYSSPDLPFTNYALEEKVFVINKTTDGENSSNQEVNDHVRNSTNIEGSQSKGFYPEPDIQKQEQESDNAICKELFCMNENEKGVEVEDSKLPTKCNYCHKKFNSTFKLSVHLSNCLKQKVTPEIAKVEREEEQEEEEAAGQSSLNLDSNNSLSLQLLQNQRRNEIVGKKETAAAVWSHLPCFCCQVCQSVYKSISEFSSHTCHESSSLIMEKDISGLLITNIEHLHSHKKFLCGICREEYRSMERILYHLRRCTNGPYSCELCSEVFDTMKELNGHKKKTHRDQQSFFCDECGLTFKFRPSLQKHKIKQHEAKQTLFTCHECQVTFTKRIFLTDHKIRFHKLERKFLCQICGNKFSTHSSLSAHLELHIEPRKFICSYCNKKFHQKEKLTYHTRIHTGERPHLCQLCGKSFIRKSKLDDHMRRHRGEKPYQCDSCNKSYANNWDLKQHFLRHHEDSNRLHSTISPTSSRIGYVKTSDINKDSSLQDTMSVDTSESLSTDGQNPETNESDSNILVDLNKTNDNTISTLSHNSSNGEKILLQLNSLQNVHAGQNERVDCSSILLQLDPSTVPSQPIVIGGNSNECNSGILLQMNRQQEESVLHNNDVTTQANSRILVQLNPSSQNTIPDSTSTADCTSRILVQLDSTQDHAQSQSLPGNTILAVTDAINLTPLDDMALNSQYIHLASQGNISNSTSSMPLHIQLPVSAMSQHGTTYELQQVSLQNHSGMVFSSSSYDVNNLTY